MRRSIIAILFATMLLLCGCGSGGKTLKPEDYGKDAVMVFDYYGKQVTEYDNVELKDFGKSGTTVYYSGGAVEAAEGSGERKILYQGMPVWSLYLCDLTGDGVQELCSTVSHGSGIIHDRVIVYDVVNEKKYDFSDTDWYAFSLCNEGGKLCVNKYLYRFYGDGILTDAGTLSLEDGELVMHSLHKGEAYTSKKFSAISVDGVTYKASGKPLEELPEGFNPSKFLTKDELADSGTEHAILFRKDGSADVYTYQEVGLTKKGRSHWGYQRWAK